METNISRSVKHSLVIDEKDIQSIHDLLLEAYDECKVSFSCSEGSKLECDSLGDLFDYDNPKFRRITEIILKGGERHANFGEVIIFDRSYGNANLSFYGKDDARTLKLANDIESHLEECKPWFSCLSRISITLVIPMIPLVVGAANVWITFLKGELLLNSDNGWGNGSIYGVYLSLPFVVLYICCLNQIERAWKWMFPSVFFRTGRQQEEYRKRENLQKFVFIGIGLTIFLGVISNLIARKIP